MAKRKNPVVVAEVVEEGEELGIVRSVSSELQTFVANMSIFVRDVRELEGRALAVQEKVTRLPKKITKKSSDVAQALVREARLNKRAIPETWTMLKKVQSLAKAMVTKRKVSEAAFDDAIKVGQAYYFEWADAEKRRIAEEQEETRRAAEERARQEREQELADIEEAALKAEGKMPELSEREREFVECVVGGHTNREAAAAVGYANPAARAKTLMATEKITQAIDAKMEAIKILGEAKVLQSTPLDVELEDAEPTEIAGGRKNRSAQVTDDAALRDAVIAGKHGIPPEVLMVDPVALNGYARDLGPLINRWPGCRLKVKRSLV